MAQGRTQEAVVEGERSLALNPSFIDAYLALCAANNFLGRPDRALELADKAIRLSPRDPHLRALYHMKGWAFFMKRQDDQAIEWLRRAEEGAAGLGWAACRGYSEMSPTESFGDPPTDVFRKVILVMKANYFLPHPSCLTMVDDAKAKGRWIDGHTTIPEPGWLVFYNWDLKTAPPMHVEIVQEASQGKLRTIGFNTSDTSAGSQSNGGSVARKNRDSAIRFVIGYEKTWDPATPPAPPVA